MIAKHFTGIQFCDFSYKINKSLSISFFIVNQCICYQVCYRNSDFRNSEICDMQLSISYFDQILGKIQSQTRQVFNFASI